MLKGLLYSSLGLLGVFAALCSPIWGAVAVIEAYLLNPIVLSDQLATVRFQFIITAAFVLGILLRGLEPPLPKVRNETIALTAMLSYGALAMASTLWAVISADTAFDESIDILKAIFVASLLPLVIRSERSARIIIWALLVGVAHAAFMHVLGPRFGWLPRRFSREFGPLPDTQSSVMILFVPLFALFAVYSKRWREKAFCLASLLVSLDSIVNSYQRAYFVALLVQAVMLTILLPKRIVLRLIPVATFAVILFSMVFTPDNYWSWMTTISDYEDDRSANVRIELSKVSLKIIREFPFGVGYRNYPWVSPRYLDASYLTQGTRAAHNTFFTVACETGLLGLALFLAAFGAAMLIVRRIRRSSDSKCPTEIQVFSMGMEIGLLGWGVGGLFHSDHEVDPAFWFIGLAVAMARVAAHQLATVSPRPEHATNPMTHVAS